MRLITLDMLPDMVEPPIIVPPDVGDPARTDFVYLDVWERHITAIEDPDIRESALGGPDTTTRTKTICQVRLLPDVGDVTCEEDIPNYPPPAGDARLTTRADAPPDSTWFATPCVIAPGGGYRGLENLLYRVEIHYGSSSGTPTFKWSRHNGSVVYAVEAFVPGEPEKVRVKQLGRDQMLTLKTDDWVEVCDDATDLSSSPGVMAQIVDIDAAQRILTLSKPEPTVEKEVAVQSDIVGKSVNSAKAKLERTGATVTKIEPFDESAGVANVIRAGAAPNRIPPQAEVTLFEENGVVKYYRVDSPRISIAVDRERESIQPDIGVAQPVDAQETITVPGLNARLEEMRSSILKKDNEIERLRVQVNELETARAQVNELETELKDMREFRKQVERFMRRNNG